MRIGLSAGASTVDRTIEQAVEAERDGFTSQWFAGAMGIDPMVVIPLCGRATERIELGTSVVQTYPRHPVQMAATASAVAATLHRDGEDVSRFTLGVGVSHRPSIENTYGLSYDNRAQHLDEYVQILAALLNEGRVEFKGEEYAANAQVHPPSRVSVLVAALNHKSLTSAGTHTDGTITWMANRKAIESFVAPKLREAAHAAGRAEPRIVVGLPIAVCDDVAEGRAVAGKQFAGYGRLPNYQRILAKGGVESPADAAIVGPEDEVAAELKAMADGGMTDFWAAIFPVGEDRRASRERTRKLLKELVAEG